MAGSLWKLSKNQNFKVMKIEKLLEKLESLKTYSAYSDSDNEVHLEKDPHGDLIKSEDLNEIIEKLKSN